MRPLEAYETVMRFAAERGEPTLRLALHVSVPKSFRPDFVHLVRLNFVPEASREAEVDVLLAAFCEDIGGGFYEFDPEARRLLLDNLDPYYPDERGERVRRVADFVLAYSESRRSRWSESQDRLDQDFLAIQEWVALAFLDPDLTAMQLAAALDQRTAGDLAVRLQFSGLTSALSTPLVHYNGLLTYAAAVEALEQGRPDHAGELLGRLPDEVMQVGSLTLRSPHEGLGNEVQRFRATETTRGKPVRPHSDDKALQPLDRSPQQAWTSLQTLGFRYHVGIGWASDPSAKTSRFVRDLSKALKDELRSHFITPSVHLEHASPKGTPPPASIERISETIRRCAIVVAIKSPSSTLPDYMKLSLAALEDSSADSARGEHLERIIQIQLFRQVRPWWMASPSPTVIELDLSGVFKAENFIKALDFRAAIRTLTAQTIKVVDTLSRHGGGRNYYKPEDKTQPPQTERAPILRRSEKSSQTIEIQPKALTYESMRPEVYISYAWGDLTPQGKYRLKTIDSLYRFLKADGYLPIRGSDALRRSDSIARMFRNLTFNDLVLVVISEEYLRSPFCLYELYLLWQMSHTHPNLISRLLIPIILPEVELASFHDRIKYIESWVNQTESARQLTANQLLQLDAQAIETRHITDAFVMHVDDLLVFVNDVLMPRRLEANFDDGFRAVRSALRRRLAGRASSSSWSSLLPED